MEVNMKNNKQNLIVLFSGANYTADMPLLYYAKYKYDLLGYESMKVSYTLLREKASRPLGMSYGVPCGYTLAANMESVDIVINSAYENTLEQLKDVDFTKYDEILFVSKSLGTVVAGRVAAKIEKAVKHIFLTPMPQAIEYIERNNYVKLVVFGTADDSINCQQLREHCESEHIKYMQIEDVGHRLEKMGDINYNIDVLKKIVDSY